LETDKGSSLLLSCHFRQLLRLCTVRGEGPFHVDIRIFSELAGRGIGLGCLGQVVGFDCRLRSSGRGVQDAVDGVMRRIYEGGEVAVVCLGIVGREIVEADSDRMRGNHGVVRSFGALSLVKLHRQFIDGERVLYPSFLRH